MVLEKKIFKFRQCIFAISQLSPLGRGQGLSFEHNGIPFTQGCFVSSLVEIGRVVLEKKEIFILIHFNYDANISSEKKAGLSI